jgi:hypothetical protein
MMAWPFGLPPYDRSDHWARRAAAWAASLLPTEIIRAVPDLAVWPRAAGRVAWYHTTATLAARGRAMDNLAMSAVVPVHALDGLLTPEDVSLIRDIEVPVDRSTPTWELERRLEELQAVGKWLPAKWPQ